MKNSKLHSSGELIALIISNIKSKRFDEALVLLEKISDKDSNIINSLKGSIYLSKQVWEKSLIYYRKIPDKEKTFKILNNIGFALFKLGRFSEASLKFIQSINNNKVFIPAYKNIVISYKLMGQYDLAVKYILKGLNIMPENDILKNHLIDIFNYHQTKIYKNETISINHLIKKFDPVKRENELIKSSLIKNILEKSEVILKDQNISFNYPETQIFRRNKLRLHCERQFGIFNQYKIIPKFCFRCYKVQISLANVVDLIKLYFYFNDLHLEKNNTRKCMIELRENISGNYKGFIYVNSIKEAKNIKKVVENDLINKDINLKKIDIKHGCSEFYDQFNLFKNTNEDITNKVYQKEWENIENDFDRDNFITENIKEKVFNNTLNKFNLPDFLVIKNWLLYAKIINDNSVQQIFKFELNN